MTPGLRNVLHDLAARDPHRLGAPLGPSNDRSTAVRLGLIIGKPMKSGHRKKYYLTAKGYAAIGIDP